MTIREHGSLGYVLKDVVIVFTRKVPSSDKERRDWCTDPQTILRLRDVLQERVGPLSIRTQINISQRILWDIVPIFGEYPTIANKVKTGGRSFTVLDVVSINSSIATRQWFHEQLKEFHQMGGGQFIVESAKSPEVEKNLK